MSRWFPEVDNQEGIQQALKGGMIGALAFAGSIVLGAIVTVVVGRYPGSASAVTGFELLGMVIELAVVLVTAWRFKIGKGMFWGMVCLVLFALELIGKLENGTARVGWIFFYAAIATGLINGVRGAWARRNLPLEPDYADVFE